MNVVVSEPDVAKVFLITPAADVDAGMDKETRLMTGCTQPVKKRSPGDPDVW